MNIEHKKKKPIALIVIIVIVELMFIPVYFAFVPTILSVDLEEAILGVFVMMIMNIILIVFLYITWLFIKLLFITFFITIPSIFHPNESNEKKIVHDENCFYYTEFDVLKLEKDGVIDGREDVCPYCGKRLENGHCQDCGY